MVVWAFVGSQTCRPLTEDGNLGALTFRLFDGSFFPHQTPARRFSPRSVGDTFWARACASTLPALERGTRWSEASAVYGILMLRRLSFSFRVLGLTRSRLAAFF